jgi:hypothetical protein
MRTVSLLVRIVSLYVDSCSAGAVTWQARHIGARKIVEDELGQSCMMDDTIILMSICDGSVDVLHPNLQSIVSGFAAK